MGVVSQDAGEESGDAVLKAVGEERILGLYWLDWEASFYFQINNNIFIS